MAYRWRVKQAIPVGVNLLPFRSTRRPRTSGDRFPPWCDFLLMTLLAVVVLVSVALALTWWI
jgi:Tfp pilus assembly protein PilN